MRRHISVGRWSQEAPIWEWESRTRKINKPKLLENYGLVRGIEHTSELPQSCPKYSRLGFIIITPVLHCQRVAFENIYSLELWPALHAANALHSSRESPQRVQVLAVRSHHLPRNSEQWMLGRYESDTNSTCCSPCKCMCASHKIPLSSH